MLDFNEFRNTNEYMIRKEPRKIYLFSNLLIITTIFLIVIGIILKYNKYDAYLANIFKEKDNYYLNIVISESNLQELNQCELIIEENKYDFKIIEMTKNELDNNYNIVLDIGFADDKLKENKYFIIKLKHKETTIFKEIIKRIKEELN